MSKKSKQKTETKPWNAAAINGAQNTLNSTVKANAPHLDANAGLIRSTLPGLADKVNEGDPMVGAAKGYASDVLGGKYLTGNPHLEAMIGKAMGDVGDRYNSTFSMAGRTGGSQHREMLSEGMGNAVLGLRYGDYEGERDRMGQMASLAPALTAADLAPMQALISGAGAASEIPFIGSKVLAQGTAGLQSPWGTQTTTQSGGLGQSLMGLAGLGLAGFDIFRNGGSNAGTVKR